MKRKFQKIHRYSMTLCMYKTGVQAQIHKWKVKGLEKCHMKSDYIQVMRVMNSMREAVKREIRVSFPFL